MAEQQKMYRYHFMTDNTLMEMGITDNLSRRQAELLQVYPDMHGHIMQVGMEPVTRAEAEQWLAAMRKLGMPVEEQDSNGA